MSSQLRLCAYVGSGHYERWPEHVESVSILIGPEGGLTEQEFLLAGASGFDAFSLGPRVLRTETASVVALSLLQSRYGDLS